MLEVSGIFSLICAFVGVNSSFDALLTAMVVIQSMVLLDNLIHKRKTNHS